MKLNVLRTFNHDGREVKRGDTVDLPMTIRVQKMIEQRFFILADADVAVAADVAPTPSVPVKTKTSSKGA